MLNKRASRGQAMVEFALVAPIFMILLLGIVDLGRAIYGYNGASEAAREIARVASVHPGNPLGSSTEVQAAIRLQKSLVPGISDPTFHCLNASGGTVPGDGSGGCAAPDFVQVIVNYPYQPAALLGIGNTVNITSSSSNQIQ